MTNLMFSNKKACLFSFLLFLILLPIKQIFAQDNSEEVLITVGNNKVSKTEFLNVYQKNNVKGDAMDRKSLEDYLNLYINFRLKVKEAEEMGLDTMKSFTDELNGYRKQLAQPYLIDEDVNKALLDEAYARKQEDIRASHILVKVDRNAAPKDTLEAYNKILKIRERILDGEDFGTVATEVSDDLSAKDRTYEGRTIRGNRGDLGYFTVFDMVYPFETGAYNTLKGEISMPVRSDYGYHIVKVTDRKPAMGKVQVAHILLLFPKNANAQDSARLSAKADSIYQMATRGDDFAALAKATSDDKGSASKGGVIPWFSANKIIPEYIYQVNLLKNKGDISKPFCTSYGWHIIKLIDKKDIPGFDEAKAEIKQALAKSDRSLKSKESFISKIKAEYFFTEIPKTRTDFYTVIDTSFFHGKWEIEKAKSLNKNMFVLGEKTFTQQDFANYLTKYQREMPKQNIQVLVDNQYRRFVDENCLAYEDSQLENKYPEFRSLMKEYRDGILLFNLTDQKIWSKAVKDTVGLQDYYEKTKTTYMWGDRLDASVYTIKDAKGKTAKKVRKLIDKGTAEEDILKAINVDSTQVLAIEHKNFSKGDNPLIDNIKWEKSITENKITGDTTVFVVVHRMVAPEPKLLNEIRGLVTADYQTFLEKEWIKTLREKYPVTVNKEVFETLIKQ